MTRPIESITINVSEEQLRHLRQRLTAARKALNPQSRKRARCEATC
jgi:hypothetical protein